MKKAVILKLVDHCIDSNITKDLEFPITLCLPVYLSDRFSNLCYYTPLSLYDSKCLNIEHNPDWCNLEWLVAGVQWVWNVKSNTD